MAEDFSTSQLIIPGTFIRVRAEGLISVGGISTGNIGIVGTAVKMIPKLKADGTPEVDGDGNPVLEADSSIYGKTFTLSDYESARNTFGDYDAMSTGKLNLNRGIEQLYLNGARTVYARAFKNTPAPKQDDFIAAFNELAKDNVNIFVAPELTTDTAKAVFSSVLETAENNGKDIIAVIGSDKTSKDDIKGQVTANDRIILAAPGIMAFDAVAGSEVTLSGTYTAAVVAGLLSTLVPQSSPTNKVVSGVTKLAQRFSYGETKDLISGGVLVLEERLGIRAVRGITTEMANNGPFKQITTRRITDFAKAGIRQAADPFIGRLNNVRVRKALQTTIDGFLTTMVQDEALVGYNLQVTATRQDEIAGRAVVNATLLPTFSIDFVTVTLVLE